MQKPFNIIYIFVCAIDYSFAFRCTKNLCSMAISGKNTEFCWIVISLAILNFIDNSNMLNGFYFFAAILLFRNASQSRIYVSLSLVFYQNLYLVHFRLKNGFHIPNSIRLQKNAQFNTIFHCQLFFKSRYKQHKNTKSNGKRFSV